MRKILLAGAAIALLSAGMAQADDGDKRAVGGVAGGAAGAAAGAVIGGPVGAAVGGIAGFIIGGEAAVPEDARVYVSENPAPAVVLDGPLTEETRFNETVALTPIPNHPDLAYVYIDNRPVIVRVDDRQVVYAAAPAATMETTASVVPDIPEATITYVERHPLEPVILEGPVQAGTVIPDTVQIVEVPEQPAYGYVYVDQRPVLVDRTTREVMWVR